MPATETQEFQQAEALSQDKSVKIDREKGIIYGLKAAQVGEFKSDGRGQFTEESLAKIVELGNQCCFLDPDADPEFDRNKGRGLRMRFRHPSLSDDGSGKMTGRSRNFRLSRTGKTVLFDHYFNPTALKPPPEGGGQSYGEYLMDLLESDPGAIQTSLVLTTEKIRIQDDKGEDKEPPIWMPEDLKALDWVDTGDAVHGDALSFAGAGESYPDVAIRKADELLTKVFKDRDGEEVRERTLSWANRYFKHKYGLSPVKFETGEPNDSLNPKGDDPMSTDTQPAETQKNEPSGDSQLASMVEKLSAKVDDLLDREKTKSDELDAEKRKNEILQLCAEAGFPDEGPKYCQSDLSADQVRKDLWHKLTQQGQLKTSPGTGEEKLSDEQKLEKEFKENSDLYRRMGMSLHDLKVAEGLEKAEEN